MSQPPRKGTKRASQIPKTWLDRGNAGVQRSRGMERDNNQCFMLSVLQSLMHQPQLLNWLETHNQTIRHGRFNQTINRCNDPGDCVACALINLMNEYWANTPTRQPIPNPGPALEFIEDIALRHGSAEFDESDATYEAENRRQRIEQSDACEFYDMLLRQLEESSADTNWKAQCRSLFTLTTSERIRCIEPSVGGTPCNHESRLAPYDESGIILNFDPNDDDIDSIQDLLDNYFTREVPYYFCNTCATNGNHYFYTQIEAAPRILKVRLMIFLQYKDDDKNWIRDKNLHELESPNPLDLTQYQKHAFFPLRYELSSVVAHEGNLDSGHYIASVRGQGGRCFRISDDLKERIQADVLEESPQRPGKFWTGTEFQTYVLTYLRQDVELSKEQKMAMKLVSDLNER